VPGLVAFYNIQPGNGSGLFFLPWSLHGSFAPQPAWQWWQPELWDLQIICTDHQSDYHRLHSDIQLFTSWMHFLHPRPTVSKQLIIKLATITSTSSYVKSNKGCKLYSAKLPLILIQ